jgi:hypothetical protein
MKSGPPSLIDRVGRMHRQLLLLQRLCQLPRDGEPIEWLSSGDEAKDAAFGAAIRELVDELIEHAQVLTSIPSPISEWQPGDGPDDERWRALTEVERREVLAMVAGYENLISWSEDVARSRPGPTLQDSLEFLKAERARLVRFRQEMGFLDRRRVISHFRSPGANAS